MGINDVTNEKTQITEFPKMNTDWLLSLRSKRFFDYPRFAGDKYLGYGDFGWMGYRIDQKLLREILATRPNRVRKRDRRKKI